LCLKEKATLTSEEEIYGIVLVFAAAMVALTVVDTLMIGVNRSFLPTLVKIQFVRFGEWLFFPAAFGVGLASGVLGSKKAIPVMASAAAAFIMITQFRGAWIWSGTFDKYDEPRTAWIVISLSGLLAGGIVAGVRPAPPRAELTIAMLISLALCVLVTAMTSKMWPGDSDFAPTRYISLLVSLLILSGLAIYARRVE
jgi:hypothetical protein